MNKTTITTQWGTDTISLRANWAEAGDQIERLGPDGEWSFTGMEVADFHHSAHAALREELRECAQAERMEDDEAEEAIEAAMSFAEEE